HVVADDLVGQGGVGVVIERTHDAAVADVVGEAEVGPTVGHRVLDDGDRPALGVGEGAGDALAGIEPDGRRARRHVAAGVGAAAAAGQGGQVEARRRISLGDRVVTGRHVVADDLVGQGGVGVGTG